MKKTSFLLLLLLCCLSIQAQQEARFYFKNGVSQSWKLNDVDSITYLQPAAQITLPASCQLEAGTSAKLTYMVSDGLQNEQIEWGSSDNRIAYFYDDQLYAKKAGKCIIRATYKGVTSSCIITVTPSVKDDLTQLIALTPLACYSMAEMGVYLSQAITTSRASQTGSYPYSQGWDFLSTNGHPHWHFHCNEIAPITQQLLAHAADNHYHNIQLITRTIQLMTTMLATDIYGDMPLTLLGKVFNPTFQTQQQIYDWMFKEADELVQLYNDPAWVNSPTNIALNQQIDPIYGGDLHQWKLCCQAIRARLWLRKLPNWDNTAANCQKIIAMVDEVLNDAYWQEPRYYYPGGIASSNCPWGPFAPSHGVLSANRLASSIPTTFFLHAILGGIDGRYVSTRGYALDPRAAMIMEQRTSERGAMLHLESNIGISNIQLTIANYPDLYTYDKRTNPYTQNTGYIPLITEEELLFIKAEAQYWAGDIPGAFQTTKAATKFNMERYSLNEVDIQSGLQGTNIQNQYNRFFEIKLPSADNFTIADLMQQKYVAMYLQPEQWTDMRRYNYSSSTNGIAYVHPRTGEGVYVYDVHNVHNGRASQFKQDSVNFEMTYSLRRPYNLYEPYWLTDDDKGVNAQLSPNAWVMRINPTTNATGEPTLDPQLLRKRMIWAYNTCGKAISFDNAITWK